MSDQSHEEGYPTSTAPVAADHHVAVTAAAVLSPVLVSSAAVLSDPGPISHPTSNPSPDQTPDTDTDTDVLPNPAALSTITHDATVAHSADAAHVTTQTHTQMSAVAAVAGNLTDNPSEAATQTASPPSFTSPTTSPSPISSLALPDPTHAPLSSSSGAPSGTCTSTTPSDAQVPSHASQASQASPSSQTSLPSVSLAAATGASDDHHQDLDHVDPGNKKNRPPLVNHRSSGASLLTQALASARGIPSSQTVQKEQRGSGQKPPQSNESSQPNRTWNKTNESSATHISIIPRNESLGQSSDSSTTPTSLSLPAEIARAEDLSSQSADPRSKTDTATTPITMPHILHETSLLASHRDLSKTLASGGRSLERTVKELKLSHTSAPQTPSVSSGNTGGIPRSHTAGPQGIPLHTEDRRELPSDPGAQNRPRRSDRTMSMGPEKVWSIDTDDIIGSQDGQGQVEKSITEVLAGVEPTRSRKASHSLRFFKQALPDDKGKRKETREGSHHREKLPPTEEDPSETSVQTRHEDQRTQSTQASHSPKKDLPSPSPLISGQSLPSSRPPETPSAAERLLGPDYFSLSRNRREHIKSPVKGAPGLEKHSVTPAVDEVLRQDRPESLGASREKLRSRRGSVCSTDDRDQGETGEDSSEEKISSAVFLPHQGLEEPRDIVEGLPPSVNGTQNVPRRSTKEDFHPWLVKADEQEAGSDGEKTKHGDDLARKVEPVQKTKSFPVTLEEECAIEEDVESSQRVGIPSQMPPRTTSHHPDDLAHDHQVEEEKPLEAIELIPYKHQVGGHTTLWRFSKRAVCKQLNNRENEFYENIERYHRDLLPFLPRCVRTNRNFAHCLCSKFPPRVLSSVMRPLAALEQNVY